MASRRRPRTGVVVGIVVGVIVLAAASTVAIASTQGAFRSSDAAPDNSCVAPALPGTVVDVRLMNMGGRMMSASGMMGGTARVVTDRAQVSAGTASFRVANVGSLVHELVVLPLKPGSRVGERAVGSDGRVDEEGSLGEASRSCGAGTGDGIAPGSLGWVTIDLPAGDYELVCNLAGHYAAGMYTLLHVS